MATLGILPSRFKFREGSVDESVKRAFPLAKAGAETKVLCRSAAYYLAGPTEEPHDLQTLSGLLGHGQADFLEDLLGNLRVTGQRKGVAQQVIPMGFELP